MSSSRELQFVEVRAGQWYYILENINAPRDCWDWMEFSKAYGPFTSLEKAEYHQYDLSRISTSGHEIVENSDFKLNNKLASLINEATLKMAW